MRRAAILFIALATAMSALAALPEPGTPGAPVDARYCGEPARDAQGRIKRSAAERARFVAAWPKPQTGEWHVDHVIPLANGGCDLPFNMQWLPIDIKNCPGEFCKDRWERKVYKVPR